MLKIELYETLLLNNGAAFFPDIQKMAMKLGISTKYIGKYRPIFVDDTIVGAINIPELNKKYGFSSSVLLFYFKSRAKYLLRYYNVDSFYKIKYLIDKAVRMCKTLYEKGKRVYPYPIPREKIWIFGRPTKEDIISIFGKELI